MDSLAEAPTVSYSLLFRALSKPRVSAYSLESDTDSVDAVARYVWNIAVCAAMLPVLHLVEVSFRNALYETGVETTAGRVSATRTIPCWLDAVPSLLQPSEARDVAQAIRQLGTRRRRLTPGHLVGHLGFGFWVRLGHRPYEHGWSAGPRLWPHATKRFAFCPRRERNRADIQSAFAQVRDFRNLLAHHQPVWDLRPVEVHARALELLGWMNPRLAGVAAYDSSLPRVYDAGPEGYRKMMGAAMRIA
jgi:hypothetical protein